MGLKITYDEGQTPLEDEELEGLKIPSISTKGELNEHEALNIEKATIWIIKSKFKVDEIFTEKFIRKVHKRMYGDVWKWAGEFRRSNKNIGCEWIQVPIELKRLCDDVIFWVKNKTYSSEEIAIRFKHRIVSIHCFPNGNGRHSRLMADIIMESIFNEDIFSWNQSSLVKADETRKSYIKSLRKADCGDVNDLIVFARG